MAKVPSPFLLKSHYNLYCIKDLSVIFIFEIPSDGNKCTKEYL